MWGAVELETLDHCVPSRTKTEPSRQASVERGLEEVEVGGAEVA